MLNQKILVTGGAGYIGSHTVLELLKLGYEVIVVDSLERGYLEAIDRVKKLSGESLTFVKGDLKIPEFSQKLLSVHKPDAVIHFAAYKSVEEGERDPDSYFKNNVTATEYLLQSMVDNNVKKIIFSSSAAVYGQTEILPITEEVIPKPINVYGQTKLQMEELINEYTIKFQMKSLAFRYFNAVGADESGQIGEDPRNCTNLIPIVMHTLSGKRKEVFLFGDRFKTKDGSQERDYIHVSDLATAHVKSLSSNLIAGKMEIINLSTENSTSCKDIFKIAEDISGKKLNFTVQNPRKGDPEIVYASKKKSSKFLNWEPTRNIEKSIKDQWNWTMLNPNGYSY
jgi:UDP-glucose 4-epimerase